MDDRAEYRDKAFLERVGLERLSGELEAFWPKRGPQWDALAVTDRNDVLLVEAKAHIRELCSSGSSAGPVSRARLVDALTQTAASLGATRRAPWQDTFYQLANRLAHLDFLRAQGVSTWLVLVNFVGDKEVGGPSTRNEWEAAYTVAHYAMGLPSNHRLSRYIIHLYPDVAHLKQ